MPSDPSASLRNAIYLLVGAAAVFAMAAKIVGAENVIEPSRYAPPGESSFGFDRDDKPKRDWPAKRPEPSSFFSSNDKSRWATVRALVENGTYVVGEREQFRAEKPPYGDRGIIFEKEYESLDKVMDPETGLFYSSKPPLLSTLIAGEYWLLKQGFQWDFGRDRFWIVAVILLTWNAIPFAIYLALLAGLIERIGTTDFGKVFAFLLAAFGTFLLTFGSTLNNHNPAAYCVLFALYPLLKKSGRESGFDLASSGMFAGFAAVFDLPAAAFVAAIGLLLLYIRPGRTLLYFLPALLIPVGGLFLCNYLAMGRLAPAYSEFGGPWYEYAGSHWHKLKAAQAGQFVPGLDFAQEPKGIYAFHLLFGHHGWFSLTPAFLVSLAGLGLGLSRCFPGIGRVLQRKVPATEPVFRFELLAPLTFVVSVVVIGFFIVKTNNYGGNTSGPRWLFWLIPLWILAAIPAADRLGKWKLGKVILAVLLGMSVLSVFYPAWNPWRSPWILQLGERAGWVSYDR